MDTNLKCVSISKNTVENTNELDTTILSKEQLLAYDKYKQGGNLFITGPGGSGKTKLIQYFVHYSKIKDQKLQVCALTGCASILLNCNARTLHSWSGIKLAKGAKNKIIESVASNRNAVRNWKKAKILIIDEVSMLSRKIFEIIEEVARTIKKNTLPFGGMQIIFSGDFCQLPPVGTHGEQDTFQFCFQSPMWNTVFPLSNCIELKTIFRQNDPLYTNILNHIRKGVITHTDKDVLEKRVNIQFDSTKHNGCIPTKLFPLRAKADYVNNMMFSKLPHEDNVFELIKTSDNSTFIDTGKPLPLSVLQMCKKLTTKEIEYELNQLINNAPCVQILHLKVGAAVMCSINLDMENSICNGSQGIVIDIIRNKDFAMPVVKFSNGIIKHIHPYYWQSEEYPTISIGQYPLCLAWALTIHKIQGATLQFAEIDVGNSIFEYGQTYVALSRVQSLDGLYLSAFNYEKIQTNPIVTEFYKNIQNNITCEKTNKKQDLEKDSASDTKHIIL
jgi:ATP-dependent DNA helicase PIF1